VETSVESFTAAACDLLFFYMHGNSVQGQSIWHRFINKHYKHREKG